MPDDGPKIPGAPVISPAFAARPGRRSKRLNRFAATRAWQREDGATIVLRCGLDRPLEFNRASPLQLVNNVQWFEVRDPAGSASTWFVVDRETYIALTVPDGSGPTPLQEVSDAITANLPERALDPGPLPN